MVWVGQFSIVGGEAQEEGPWAGVFSDEPRGGDERVDLYVVVEPALPGSEEFCQQLVEAIGRIFYEQKASVTGGLLRSFLAAHVNLREWNRKSMKEHRIAAGVSALALRGHEAYLAQVGPSLGYLAGDGGLRRLQPHLPDAEEPLGLHEEFWPAFSRHELSAGDRFLLASSNLSAAGDEPLAAALSKAPEEALAEVYRLAHGLADGAVLLLAFQPELPAP